MVKGIGAARKAVDRAGQEAGVAFVLGRAGDAWAEFAGGTSGVLWGAALEAFGRSLRDDRSAYEASDVVEAAQAFADSIVHLGGASRGDKTLLDALLPFVDELRSGVEAGTPLTEAWQAAAQVAVTEAAATADLKPKVGRARPLAEKSLGTPDAGATSMGMILTRVGEVLATRAADKEGTHA
jgi:dihydroxyacetone kinase